jgi:ketosteroid isomerase-like protein
MVMIAAAVGGAVKWFGSRRGDDHDKQAGQGDDPIVRAMFKAVNDGDLDGFKEYVDSDCRLAINSLEVTRNTNVDRGFDLWADAINDARAAFPDIHWELYDELSGKDDDRHKLAVRFVSTVTVDGEKHEFEVAGFGRVEDGKLTEWHEVADQQTYNRRREQTGEEALGDD